MMQGDLQVVLCTSEIIIYTTYTVSKKSSATKCEAGFLVAAIERQDTTWCKQNVHFIAAAHIHLYRSEDSVF